MMIASVWRLFKDVYRVTGIGLPFLVLLTFLNALFDGATVAALLPLLKAVGGSLGGPDDRVTLVVTSSLVALGLPVSALGIAGFSLVLIAVGAVIFLTQAYYSVKLQTDYVAHWQQKLFASYFHAEFGFFRERRSGDLISAAITEPVRLGGAFYQANLILSSVLFIGVQLAVALFIAPFVVALLFAAATFLFVASVGLVRRGLLIGEKMTVVNADLQSDANELVQGAKFVKATGTEGRAINRLSRTIGELRMLTFANGFDVQIVRAIFEYASAVIVIALLVAGPTMLATDVGTVVVVVAMFVRLFPKVTGLRQCQQSISLVLPAFDAVSDMVRAAQAVVETAGDDSAQRAHRVGPVAISVDKLTVTIGQRTVLQDVSLEIAQGEFVALVGPTGAGKTTLVDCIVGLRQFAKGTISIDHEPLASLSLSHWRSSVGYLGQDPLLFHATIEENLRWVRPEASADDLRHALSLASAEFVYRLPHGLQTIVGDAGSRLSGGERQRIALARALLGSPRVLVLDEATSALDSETEQSVVATIASLKRHLTIVAITHRPALLDAADRILSVRDGQVYSDLSDHLQSFESERRPS